MKRYKDTNLQVTPNGDVYGPKGIRKKRTMRNGYQVVGVRVEGVSTPILVHRMVAEMYVANPNNKPEVNHKDGDKTNNHFTNLEWSTRSENMLHAQSNGLGALRLSRKDIETAAYLRNECDWTWKAIGNELGVSAEHISSVVRGKRRIVTYE